MTAPTPEAIEAGARAMFASEQCDLRQGLDLEANWMGRLSDHDREEYRRLTTAALTAAAPTIAAQAKAEALREAAEYLAKPGVVWHGDSGVSVDVGNKFLLRPKLVDWLRARAATIESEATP